MKRYVIFLGIIFTLALFGEPYKPKPILFIHGINSGSGTWGAPTENRKDSIPADSVSAHPEKTYAQI